MNEQTMFEAFKNCDSSFDGKFYVCVKTTGIYCLPSCKARLPHKKNILFVKTRKEAIERGFRGCLRCKSEFYPDVNPAWLQKLKDYLDTDIKKKIDEKELIHLAQADISTIRRYFKNEYQLTPLAYHRKQRLLHARDLIKNGHDYTSVAFETGFDSVSGFRDAFYREFSKTPGEINGNK